jgi:hypothetical protein
MSELTNYEPRGEVVAADPTGGRLVAWAQAAQAAHSLATSLVRTSFVPKAFAGNPADATAAIILGDELGLSPLSALRSLYVIGGTPALYARTMTALVMSHGHEIWTVEETEQKVTVAGRRKGSDHQESVTWTIARAQKAGYTSNKKYQTDPIAMLYARAAGDVARRIAPDVLAGVPYSVEEIELSETPTTTVTRSTVKRTVARAKVEPVEPPLDDEPTVPEPDAEIPDGADPDAITAPQLKKMAAAMRDLGVTEREHALTYVGQVIGRDVESRNDLTKAEAHMVIEALEHDLSQPADPS